MLTKKTPIALAILTATTATYAPTVWSQTSSLAIEEVVVMARKRSENLQEYHCHQCNRCHHNGARGC